MRLTGAMAGAVVLLASSLAWSSVTKSDFGKTSDGKPVELYTVTNGDLIVKITTFGARVVSLEAPDRKGKMADVVLGYDDVASYEADISTYFGAIVGRYGNRIAKGTFAIDGVTYHVPVNNNGNALHGGPAGFSTKVWTAREIFDGVEMTLVSPDGDMGFPGTLTLKVNYTLQHSSLHINYSATTTKATVVNVTNHSYFNLAGMGNVLGTELKINAAGYTPVDATQIPTGQIVPVADTPFDFMTAKTIGKDIDAKNDQLTIGAGYDHNFVLNATGPGLHVAAEAYDPGSGRILTVSTTEPGVQFYSGNFLDGTKKGKGGVLYAKHAGFCLETQHYPDSPNEPKFPTTLLKPGQTLRSVTVFAFGVKP